MEHGKTSQGKFGTYLHLGAAVLEPELDLARLQAELPAQRRPLVLVGVRALLEHPVHVRTRRTPLLHPIDHQKNWITQSKKTGEERRERVRLELLNLARGVAVVPLAAALAVGALRFVAEIHGGRPASHHQPFFFFSLSLARTTAVSDGGGEISVLCLCTGLAPGSYLYTMSRSKATPRGPRPASPNRKDLAKSWIQPCFTPFPPVLPPTSFGSWTR
jgi:hypothetical protein